MISALPLILDRLLEVMGEAPPEARPQLLAALLVGLPAPLAVSAHAAPQPDTELLKPEEAARIARVSQRTLLNVTKGQSFRRQLGHRTIRFEARGLRRWLENRAGR